MNKIIIVLVSCFLILSSCSKDEPADLSYLCANGDLWLLNRTDSLKPNHSLDSFVFNQAAGYHSFVINNSPANNIKIDVLIKPTIGQTILYKNQYIKNIKGRLIAQDFTYDKKTDSVLTITNNGSNYIISIKTISVTTDVAKTNYDIKVCDVKMTDTIP